MAFKPAVKRDAKLRFAVSGPSGSGKTYTLLKLATELVGDAGRVAYIDTEHGSASKYAHTSACAGGCTDESHFVFDVDEPTSYDPRDLVKAIDEAAAAGYLAICIDSLSHYWMGVGGELELVDNVAKGMRNSNSFAAWKTVTPYHNALVDKMLTAPIHVLVSMRTKTEWVIEKDEKGKSVPRKIGMQPVMRDGIEYEFDVCGEMDQENTLLITKTRCSPLTSKAINRPGRELANTLKVWLASPDSQVPRGDGKTDGAAQSSTQNHVPASPAQAAPPKSDEVPAPLRVIFEGLHKPGYVKQGFDILKLRMTQLNPVSGESEFARIGRDHHIVKGASLEACKAAMLEMWRLADVWQADQVAVGDDALPKLEPPKETDKVGQQTLADILAESLEGANQ